MAIIGPPAPRPGGTLLFVDDDVADGGIDGPNAVSFAPVTSASIERKSGSFLMGLVRYASAMPQLTHSMARLASISEFTNTNKGLPVVSLPSNIRLISLGTLRMRRMVASFLEGEQPVARGDSDMADALAIKGDAIADDGNTEEEAEGELPGDDDDEVKDKEEEEEEGNWALGNGDNGAGRNGGAYDALANGESEGEDEVGDEGDNGPLGVTAAALFVALVVASP